MVPIKKFQMIHKVSCSHVWYRSLYPLYHGVWLLDHLTVHPGKLRVGFHVVAYTAGCVLNRLLRWCVYSIAKTLPVWLRQWNRSIKNQVSLKRSTIEGIIVQIASVVINNCRRGCMFATQNCNSNQHKLYNITYLVETLNTWLKKEHLETHGYA